MFKVRLAAACAFLFGSAAAQAATGTITVYPNFGSYCSASQCGTGNGSASGTTLSDGKTVVAIVEGPLGSGRYIGIYVAGFSSDPGAGYLSGATCDGTTYWDNEYHSYFSNGTVYFQWTTEEAISCFGNASYPSDGPHTVTVF
jgi:hypothetical protein